MKNYFLWHYSNSALYTYDIDICTLSYKLVNIPDIPISQGQETERGECAANTTLPTSVNRKIFIKFREKRWGGHLSMATKKGGGHLGAQKDKAKDLVLSSTGLPQEALWRRQGSH